MRYDATHRANTEVTHCSGTRIKFVIKLWLRIRYDHVSKVMIRLTGRPDLVPN